ncbi:MAG: PilZ domain-containing protein [Candidatus Binatia bacterium]
MSIKTFLTQRAVNIAVGGSYTLANWLDPEGKPRTFACRTSRVSPFRMMVDVPVVGKLGDRITPYFGDFGKLEGHITDTTPGGFLLELTMDNSMRAKIAGQLSWLEKKQKDASVREARMQARIIPISPHSALTFADGTIHSCLIIDMSVSGAAIAASVQPTIGTPLAVGTSVGRVVRHLLNGFAVQFVEPQNRLELDRRITRPAPTRAADGATAAPRSFDQRLATAVRERTLGPKADGANTLYLDD